MEPTDSEKKYSRELKEVKSAQFRGNLSSAAQIGSAAALGSQSQAINRATDKVAGVAISRSAHSIARRLRSTRRKNRSRTGEQARPEKKKLTGAMFYVMLSLTLIKDGLDVFLDLSIIFSIITVLTAVAISMLVLVYLLLSDVKLDSRKLATYLTSVAIEAVPFLNAVPAASINLILIRLIENEQLGRLIRRVARVVK